MNPDQRMRRGSSSAAKLYEPDRNPKTAAPFTRRVVVVGELEDDSIIENLVVSTDFPNSGNGSRPMEDRTFPTLLSSAAPRFGADGQRIDEETDHEVWPEVNKILPWESEHVA